MLGEREGISMYASIPKKKKITYIAYIYVTFEVQDLFTNV